MLRHIFVSKNIWAPDSFICKFTVASKKSGSVY